MDNYEYIIASLPVLTQDMRDSNGPDPEGLVRWIRSQCSARDNALIDILEEGFDQDRLGDGFYAKALASRNSFIRDYFSYDLMMRNEKVKWLNKALGRPEGQDTVSAPMPDAKEAGEVAQALDTSDILGREKAMDNLLWNKIGAITTFNYFDVNVILAFIAKLHIIWRWIALDPVTGKEMFEDLVDEVRGTFKGVNYQPEN